VLRGEVRLARLAVNAAMDELAAVTQSDLEAVSALLQGAGLPTSDLETARPEFLLVREGGRIIAAGALQRFGSIALVRSVVVAPERRGGALGRRIVEELERAAREARVARLVLLTQTARDFFAHLGYRVIERSEAPEDVQGTEEFRSLCPASATCMVKII
jgi:amino-acid N-acetyltransferase